MAGNWQRASPHPGEWVRGKLVGSGSFGTVHLAMSKSTGALFVVKSAQSEAGLRSLENEADILENLNSPHIVQCIGRDSSNGRKHGKEFNLFIEYIAGGSLFDLAEKFGGALDERVVRLYTREILLGLNYLHEKGIAHCDLKCKNVLVGSAGNVKLGDFGCAKRLNEGNSNTVNSSTVIGTPLWMAPEVLRNEGLDFSADIWSLGCTVIEMATGRPPWGGEVSNVMAAVMKIACGNEAPEFPTGFSKEGIDFLAKCLERIPRTRCTAKELLDHPFVSGTRLRKEEGACSPASILDVGVCEEGYESEESLGGGDQIKSRFSFLKGRSEQQRTENTSWKHQSDTEFSSSEGWITVRSVED